MVRTVPAALQSHFDGQSHTRADLLTIERVDGMSVRLTSHFFDLTIESELYTGQFLDMSDVDAGVNEVEASGEVIVSLAAGSPITADDIHSGRYRAGARHEVAICNYADPAAGKIVLLRGFVGEIQMDDNERIATIQLGGLLSGTGSAQFDIERYSPTGRATLGDARCRLPVLPGEGITKIRERVDGATYAVDDYVRVFQSGSWDNRSYRCITAGTLATGAPVYDTTIGNDTTDGTAVFRAEDAWPREAVVTAHTGQFVTVTVTEARADDDWFKQGYIVPIDGNNATEQPIEIINWDNTGKVMTLARPPLLPFAIGDKLFMVPGCDKTGPTCRFKFSNKLNFCGEEHTDPSGALRDAYSI